MSITPYPAVALIFDRMSPAYSLTRTLSTSRRRLTFKQESGSERRSGTKQINCMCICIKLLLSKGWIQSLTMVWCFLHWDTILSYLERVAWYLPRPSKCCPRPQAESSGNIFNSEVTVFNCMYGPHSRQITSLFFPAVNWLTSGFVSFFQLCHWIDSRPVYKPFVKYSS